MRTKSAKCDFLACFSHHLCTTFKTTLFTQPELYDFPLFNSRADNQFCYRTLHREVKVTIGLAAFFAAFMALAGQDYE